MGDSTPNFPLAKPGTVVERRPNSSKIPCSRRKNSLLSPFEFPAFRLETAAGDGFATPVCIASAPRRRQAGAACRRWTPTSGSRARAAEAAHATAAPSGERCEARERCAIRSSRRRNPQGKSEPHWGNEPRKVFPISRPAMPLLSSCYPPVILLSPSLFRLAFFAVLSSPCFLLHRGGAVDATVFLPFLMPSLAAIHSNGFGQAQPNKILTFRKLTGNNYFYQKEGGGRFPSRAVCAVFRPCRRASH